MTKPIRYASPISTPNADTDDLTQLPTVGQMADAISTAVSGLGEGGGGSAVAPLSSVWTPELDRYPVVDGTNGPLTADSGIISGDLPSSGATPPLLDQADGMRFIAWDDVDIVTGQPFFNYQGMVPAPAPANIQSSAGRDCLLNAHTPRWFNGSTGQYYNGTQSIRVGIASTKVVPVWYVAQGQLSATTVDMHVMVEHGGANKHLSSSSSVVNGLPRNITGGSGTYRRELTYVDMRYREHRFILSPNSYFLGCWVDTNSIVQRPKNRPQVFVHGTDSWNDPQTFFSSPGYTWPGGDWQCLSQNIVASFFTGMCHGTDAQGGTGEYNPNGISGGELSTYSGNRSSAAWSDSRVNWRANWWSSQFPIFLDIGGWNDGNSMESPYQSSYKTRVQTRVQKTIDACEALGRETRFVNVGIQGVDVTSTSAAKYLAALGQGQVPALFPGVVLGHVSLMPLWWQDTTTSGPRTLYCYSGDHIHLIACGDDAVAGFYVDKMGEFPLDDGYMAKTGAADVPIVNVPTS